VAEAPDRFRLALEAPVELVLRAQLRGQHLERDHAADRAVARPVDDAHGAFAQLAEDLVAAEGGHGLDDRKPGALRRAARRVDRIA
jgi:hypothetical protein